VATKKRTARKPKRLTSEQFFDRLRKRNKRNAARVDKEIEELSLDDVTVMMVDSSGFTRKTHAYGILQFLTIMTHCYDKIIPRLEARGGITLSRNADNIFALFEKPDDAVRAAIDMQQWLHKWNKGKSDAEQYSVCIGINSGTVVRLADNVYGDMVNIAAKLGEDVAAKDQILITGVVAEQVGKRFDTRYDRTIEVGKEVVALHEVQYEVPKGA